MLFAEPERIGIDLAHVVIHSFNLIKIPGQNWNRNLIAFVVVNVSSNLLSAVLVGLIFMFYFLV